VAAELGITAEPRRLDSQAKYAIVARGEAQIYLRIPTKKGYEEKIWDHAAGCLCVQEAGGRVSDLDGRDLDFSQGRTLKANRGVVATNGKIHDQVLAAVGPRLRFRLVIEAGVDPRLGFRLVLGACDKRDASATGSAYVAGGGLAVGAAGTRRVPPAASAGSVSSGNRSRSSKGSAT